ncbi:hypothetical protein ATANTOWER_009422, partial [Ataeniobius toweri]|nr:hypothetical protein [Ataeniobius toweri]
VDQLVYWCAQKHLELNLLKTVEIMENLWRTLLTLPPLTILNNTVDHFRFLGTPPFSEPELVFLPSCQDHGVLFAKTSRHRNSFFPQTVFLVYTMNMSQPE